MWLVPRGRPGGCERPSTPGSATARWSGRSTSCLVLLLPLGPPSAVRRLRPASRDVPPRRRRGRHRGREPHRGHGPHARPDRDPEADPLDDVGRHDGPRPRLRLEGGPGAPGPPRARGLHHPADRPSGTSSGAESSASSPEGAIAPPAGRAPAVPARGRPAGPAHPRAGPGPLDPRHARTPRPHGDHSPDAVEPWSSSWRCWISPGRRILQSPRRCFGTRSPAEATGRGTTSRCSKPQPRPRTRRTDRRRGPATVRA